MLRNSITEEEWLESSEVLGTNLDNKVGCTAYPSPKKMTLTPSSNIEYLENFLTQCYISVYYYL